MNTFSCHLLAGREQMLTRQNSMAACLDVSCLMTYNAEFHIQKPRSASYVNLQVNMILYCSYCEKSRRHVKNEQRTHARSKHNLNGNQEDFKTKQTRSHILSVFFSLLTNHWKKRSLLEQCLLLSFTFWRGGMLEVLNGNMCM